jgi:hypothetical protein
MSIYGEAKSIEKESQKIWNDALSNIWKAFAKLE